MPKYEIKIRGRAFGYDEIESAIAVPVAFARARADIVRSGYMAEVAERIAGDRDGPRIPEPALAFERAGWSFVAPTASARDGLRSSKKTSALRATRAQRVLRRSDGEIALTSDRIVLQLDPDTNGKVEKITGMSLVARRLAFGDELYLAHLPEGAELFETVERLSRVDGVRSVEPDLIEHLPQRRTPADPDFGQQWQHHENGVRSEPAWDRATGKGVRVAVIDNGFDVRHPDLRDGIDAAAAAYFANDPFGEGQFEQSLEGFPPGRHGTFCAGMTVARANDVGGCGVGFDAAFIPVACLTDQVGSQTTLAEAIAYAADPTTRGVSAPGADVISCSLGPNGARWVMRQVLAEAINFVARTGRQGRGAPIFWAATNGDYPISDDDVCSHPDVIAVSRMGPDERHDQAGHGRGLEYLAPGVDVYSTSQGRSYGFQTGCSFAAPCAAGVAVLVLERNPHLSAAECRQLLRRACRRVGGGVSYDAEGWHERYGFGCIDASLAVQPV